MVGTWVRAAISSLFLVAAVVAAEAAPDPQRIADMLAAAAAATGELTLTYESVAADEDTVILTGVRLALADEAVMTIPSLIVVGVVEREGGGFTADRIVLDGGTVESSHGAAAWETAVVEDVVVPAANEVAARSRIRPFRKLTLGGLVASEAELPDPLAVTTLSVQVGELTDDKPTSVLVQATGAELPASVVTNPIGAAMIDGLGYAELLADAVIDLDYDPSADTVVLHGLMVDAVEFGRVAVTASFSGLSFRALTDPEESAAARSAARLDAMTVRFDDGGLVGRMLDMQAEMLGGTRDEVREQLVYGALPFALSFVENAEFRGQFLAAAAAFLEDPRSLTVTVAPQAPVPLGEVMRTALRTPLKLPDLLTANVAAND